jgi:RsiW-degrading membrane proteinase PrsW (M82 family)
VQQVLVALSGVIPALVAMWIIDRLDAKRPEPAVLRRTVVLYGALSVMPAIIIEVLLTRHIGPSLDPIELTYQGASFKAFLVAAAVEEACKIQVIYWVVWRRPEFDERMDGIVYGSRAGLGFALVENVGYILMQPTLKGQLVVWIMRAFLAVPGHAMWSGMIGYSAARRRFDGHGLGLVGGYLLAVAFHGFYDASVFMQTPLAFEGHTLAGHIFKLAPIALTVAAFFVLRAMAKAALHLDDADAAKAAVNAAKQQAEAKPPAPPPGPTLRRL